MAFSRFENVSPMFAQLAPALVAVLIVTFLSASCTAQHVFDFVEDDTGSVLATLELLKLPARTTDIASLEFSEEGARIYGFGPTYIPEFVSENNGVPEAAVALDVFDGELRGASSFGLYLTDQDPGFTSINPDPAYSWLSLIFPSALGESPAGLNFQGRISTGPGVLRRSTGIWQAVPEPSAAMLLLALGSACFLSRTRRMSNCRQ